MNVLNEERPNIETVKEIINRHAYQHRRHISRCRTAERYYRNENDILRKGARGQDTDPVRNADNRIPRNFHGLLVNQKTAYMFTAPPLFDTGKESLNKRIADILGDGYAKVCKDLCVDASNCGCAWLHYWTDDDGSFKYGVLGAGQVIPVYSSSLVRTLAAVLRTYRDVDFNTGKEIAVWEYWDREYCYVYFRRNETISINGLEPYSLYDDGEGEKSSIFRHNYGRVPFIPFYNNNIQTDDLANIKPLIDAYDKVFSGFLNDLEDIQEVVYVLTNYGGEDLKEFIHDLKTYKAIKLDDDGKDGAGNVSTLTINIPVEAREKFLELTRKAIFEQGQGVDPDPQKFGNASGEALKYLYSLLELKAGLMETEFKLGFGELVRAICSYLGEDCKQIIQTWTRTAIRSEAELAGICRDSVGIVSNKTVLKNHPLVENADEEEKQIRKEKEEAEKAENIYSGAYGNTGRKGDGINDDS